MSNPNVPNFYYTKEKIREIKKKLSKYINDTNIPIVSEFAYQNNISRQALYRIDDLRPLMEKLIAKKESNLEKGGISGVLNASMTRFSLMQLGWKLSIKSENKNEHTGKDGAPLGQDTYENRIKNMDEKGLEEEEARIHRLLSEKKKADEKKKQSRSK